jgi:3-oxoacyl-[acyl-carrier-protein] synthase II
LGKRVVVTGLGVISSVGTGKDKFWDSLITCKSGIKKISIFDVSKYPNCYGGEIKDFSIESFLTSNNKKKNIERTSQLAFVAAKLGLEDAGLNVNKAGVCFGTTAGESQLMERMNRNWVEKDITYLNPEEICRYPTNRIAVNVASFLGLSGVNKMFGAACAAGNYAIGYIYDLIMKGEIGLGIAGGADSLSEVVFAGFNKLMAVAPEKCQPFDRNRKGMIPAEGAGVLVLESLESALRRKAKIYAEILGYGLSCDAYHMTHPTVEGVNNCMKNALVSAGISLQEVDYINAHGTGTLLNDKIECAAIKQVFSKRYKKIPVSSIKSMLGHSMGASSAIEAVACCLSLSEGVLPPTINYETPDSDCDIDCVPNLARKEEIKIALNNSFAFGGNNCCLVFKKFS